MLENEFYQTRLLLAKHAKHQQLVSASRRVTEANGMEPSDWQRRNGQDIEELTEGVRKKRFPILTLHSRGGISDDQLIAGLRLYADHAVGVMGVRDFDDGEIEPGTKGTGGMQGYAAVRLDALKRYREAVLAVGRPLARVLVPVTCSEMPIKDVSDMMQTTTHAIGAVLKVALEMLCIHYGMVKAIDADAEIEGLDGIDFTGRNQNIGSVISVAGEKYTLRK